MGFKEESMKIYEHAKNGDYGDYVKEVAYDFDYHGYKLMVRYDGVLSEDEREIIDAAADMGGFKTEAKEGGFWIGFYDDTFVKAIEKHHALLAKITRTEYHLGRNSIDAEDFSFERGVKAAMVLESSSNIKERLWVDDCLPPKLVVEPTGKLLLFFALGRDRLEESKFKSINKKYNENGVKLILGEITPADLYRDGYTPINEPIEYIKAWVEGENYEELTIKSRGIIKDIRGGTVELEKTEARAHSEAETKVLMQKTNNEMKKLEIFTDSKVAVANDGIDWIAKVEIDKRKITDMLYFEMKKLSRQQKGITLDFKGATIKIESKGKSLYEAVKNLNDAGIKSIKEKVRIIGKDGLTTGKVPLQQVFTRLEQMGWERDNGRMLQTFRSNVGKARVSLAFSKRGNAVIIAIKDKNGARQSTISPAKIEIHGKDIGIEDKGTSRIVIGNAFEKLEIEQNWQVLEDTGIIATKERVYDFYPFHENSFDDVFVSEGITPSTVKFDVLAQYGIPEPTVHRAKQTEAKPPSRGVSL